MSEIKRYKKPPEGLHEIMQATLLLLGTDEELTEVYITLLYSTNKKQTMRGLFCIIIICVGYGPKNRDSKHHGFLLFANTQHNYNTRHISGN